MLGYNGETVSEVCLKKQKILLRQSLVQEDLKLYATKEKWIFRLRMKSFFVTCCWSFFFFLFLGFTNIIFFTLDKYLHDTPVCYVQSSAHCPCVAVVHALFIESIVFWHASTYEVAVYDVATDNIHSYLSFHSPTMLNAILRQ